jgi:hypothetical protein
MKSIFTFFCFLLLAFQSFGQINLVPNPSFEDTVSCPFYFNQIDRSQQWSSYRGSPDYYNLCSSDYVGIPYNDAGFQFPKSGNAYAGFYSYAKFALNDREGLGIQLIQPLQIGVKYYVSFYLALAVGENQHNNIASNKIGIKFYSQPYSVFNPAPIDNFSQIVTDSIVSDSVHWTQIKGSFISDSIYSHLCISNFFVDSLTTTLSYDSLAAFSYYYIDDLVVSTDSTLAYVPQIGSIEDDVNIYYNPSDQNILIKGYNMKQYSIYNSLGKCQLEEISLISDEVKINCAELVPGMYLVKIKFENQSLVKKIIIF